MVQNLFNAAEEKCVDTEATDWEVEMTNMVDELDAIISKLTDTSYARRETCKGRIRRWFTSVIISRMKCQSQWGTSCFALFLFLGGTYFITLNLLPPISMCFSWSSFCTAADV